MVVALVILVALLGLAGYAAVAVQQTTAQSGYDRHEQEALYAAESGVAAGIEFLSRHFDEHEHWSPFVSPSNESPPSPAGIRGNGAEPGEPGNIFSEGSQRWYEVSIYNHIGDPGFADGQDEDARVILHAVGYGPNETTASLEVEISADSSLSPAGRPCPSYAQQGVDALGDGRHDCIDAVVEDSHTITPGS